MGNDMLYSINWVFCTNQVKFVIPLCLRKKKTNHSFTCIDIYVPVCLAQNSL
jgi:hypothetical protein